MSFLNHFNNQHKQKRTIY